MRLRLLATAAALLSPVLSYADVLYSYTAAGSSTRFTIDSQAFLSYSPNPVQVTTSSDLYTGGGSIDQGRLTEVTFTSQSITGKSDQGAVGPLFSGAYDIGTDGVYQAYNGSLTISGAPAAVAVTPEPSSLALLGTGILGVAGVLRKRLD
jgi:hypothetical protein